MFLKCSCATNCPWEWEGSHRIMVQQKTFMLQASDLPQPQGPCYPQYIETDTSQI